MTMTFEERRWASHKRRWERAHPGQIFKGYTFSDQHRKNMSKSQLKLEKELSSDTKKLLHDANIGRNAGKPRPEETRKKISEGNLGKNLGNPGHNLGKKLLEKTKIRISATKQGLQEAEWTEFAKKHPYCWKWTDRELKIRKRVRAFFGGRCVECGKTRKEEGHFLIVHHVSRNKDACCTGEAFEWLFVLLCHEHHMWAENNKETSIPKYKKLITEKYGGKCYYTLDEFNHLVEGRKLRSEDWGRRDGK